MNSNVVALAVLVVAAGCGHKDKDGEMGSVSPAAAAGTIDRASMVKVPTARQLEARGKSPSAVAASHFTVWKPVPAFLSAPVAIGQVLSHTEAIVLTRDNHVGITSDGGASWSFVRHTTGTVRAVAGKPGGPFAAAGDGGYLAVSTDGKTWNELPRYTNEALWVVAVGPPGIGAIGSKGAFVKMTAAGANAAVAALPDKFRASELLVNDSSFIVSSGKAGFQTSDGTTWTPVAITPAAKGTITNRGLCALGKVGKKRGVVCSVSGTAYGLSANEVVVIGKNEVSLTRDGGSTWSIAALPINGIAGVAGKPGGPYHLYDAKAAISSSADGRLWVPNPDPAAIAGAPEWPKKVAKCEGRLPAPGDSCQLAREVTSPADLPDVKAFKFLGDDGIAYGDSSLVAMTTDGGATWRTTTGYSVGGISGFDARGQRIVVAGSSRVVVSTDAGKTFGPVELPPKTNGLETAHIGADGAIYLAGRDGTILKSAGGQRADIKAADLKAADIKAADPKSTVLKSDGEVTSWVKLATGEKNRTQYLLLHEVGKVLFAAGARGELDRSADGGKTWTPVATGVGEVIRKMAGEGDTVLAIAVGNRYGGNKLLRSNDGGQHFIVQRELSDSGAVYDFAFKDGVIRLGNLASNDYGATWEHAGDTYYPGSVDIADGSGVRIANSGAFGGKDRFYVIGPEKDDVTIVDSFFNKNGRFVCDGASGCWMMAGGQIYRPM